MPFERRTGISGRGSRRRFSRRRERSLAESEKGNTMGDKGRGKHSGKGKKPKIPKMGHRPHEERQREALKSMVPEPVKQLFAERG